MYDVFSTRNRENYLVDYIFLYTKKVSKIVYNTETINILFSINKLIAAHYVFS